MIQDDKIFFQTFKYSFLDSAYFLKSKDILNKKAKVKISRNRKHPELILSEFQILDDENSSQELNDEDIEHLIIEGELDEGEDDEVYSS